MSENYDTPITIQSVDGIGKSHDFVVRFSDPIRLQQNMDHLIALRILDCSYSWFNCAQEYNNHKIKYSKDNGANWKEIKFPNGNYSYRDLNDYIDYSIRGNGDAIDKDKAGIQLSFDKAVFQCLFTLEDQYQVDLSEGEFHKLVGFNPRILTATSFSDIIPDITRSVDAILVRTNILSNTIDSGGHGDVLFFVNVDNLPLTFPFHQEPIHLSFNKLNTTTIKEIHIYLTDTLGRPVNLNNLPINLNLLLRSVPR